MTTNQTIDGVPRKLLTAVLCKLDEFNNRALVAELRALLDVSLTDEGEKPPAHPQGVPVATVMNQPYGMVFTSTFTPSSPRR